MKLVPKCSYLWLNCLTWSLLLFVYPIVAQKNLVKYFTNFFLDVSLLFMKRLLYFTTKYSAALYIPKVVRVRVYVTVTVKGTSAVEMGMMKQIHFNKHALSMLLSLSFLRYRHDTLHLIACDCTQRYLHSPITRLLSARCYPQLSLSLDEGNVTPREAESRAPGWCAPRDGAGPVRGAPGWCAPPVPCAARREWPPTLCPPGRIQIC